MDYLNEISIPEFLDILDEIPHIAEAEKKAAETKNNG